MKVWRLLYDEDALSKYPQAGRPSAYLLHTTNRWQPVVCPHERHATFTASPCSQHIFQSNPTFHLKLSVTKRLLPIDCFQSPHCTTGTPAGTQLLTKSLLHLGTSRLPLAAFAIHNSATTSHPLVTTTSVARHPVTVYAACSLEVTEHLNKHCKAISPFPSRFCVQRTFLPLALLMTRVLRTKHIDLLPAPHDPAPCAPSLKSRNHLEISRRRSRC